jgi:hypothetical protein
MTTPAFDTLRIAQALRDAGFDSGQAEAIVAAIQRSLGENVATKSDLMELRAYRDARFAGLGAELRGDLRAMETRLVRKLAALMFVYSLSTVTATVALVKLLE